MEVYGLSKDLEAFSRLVPDRQERITRSSAEPTGADPINDLAARLHPSALKLLIKEIRDETATVRTFRLVMPPGAASELPVFQAGQYISVKAQVNDSWITRPYSLASAPSDARGKDGYYEITIRRKEGGLLTAYIWEQWKEGTTVDASGPHGTFYHEPLRDTKAIIALAGGTGVAPIRSILREVAAGGMDVNVTLLCGIRTPGELLYKRELDELAKNHPDRIKTAYICSEPDIGWNGPRGFITASCISESIADIKGKTFFVCGPPEMHDFLEEELDVLDIPLRRIRKEAPGQDADITRRAGFPEQNKDMTYSLKVRLGTQVKRVPARTSETVLVALERAGIGPDAQCRSGECGFCRSLLISGNVFTKPDYDGRRAADKKFGFFHPCASYPLSDLEIKIPLTGAASGVSADVVKKRETHFDESYDAVVIGAGNGGLAAALKLASDKAKVLLLEQHNIPGGFATSFTRGRFEFETSLHELSNVGSDADKGFVRRFYQDEGKVDVEFVPVPEAYHLMLTDSGLDVVLPFGIDNFIAAVEKAAPGSKQALEAYLNVCKEVYDGIGYVSRMKGVPDGKVLVEKYQAFLTTAGYTVKEVTDKFGFSQRALQMIYPYWCYLGLPVSRLAFTIWAIVLYDYLSKGAYIPRLTSHGLSTAIDARIRELGGHTEYNTKVEKILVEEDRIVGVETAAGERIRTTQVIANASPHLVFGKLISPREAVPEEAWRLLNSRSIGGSAIVVYLGLDAPPESLGIKSYGYFIGPSLDTEEIYKNFLSFEPPQMQATVCLNKANPECSPPGTTILSMTSLVGPDVWKDVRPEDYQKAKERYARAMIEQFSKVVGVDISSHIEEIEIAAPPTFARYTGSYKGGIYGYEQDPWDSVIARSMNMMQERYIKGLTFAGGYAAMGSGYESTILSGRTAAQMVLARLKKG
ncbi:MAG: FAD-dependent oxidoreductase [Smithellaceae bacterium]|nr:FAD-dependent oxidoreductase [Smithellaceae bacterium]